MAGIRDLRIGNRESGIGNRDLRAGIGDWGFGIRTKQQHAIPVRRSETRERYSSRRASGYSLPE